MSSSTNTLDAIIDFLSSVKMALFILFALAVTAVGGTVVPQNLTPEEYLQAFGPRLYSFLYYLDMFDMYNSWWFRLLMALLVLNLVFCSIKRLPVTARLARAIDPDRVGLEFLKKQSRSETISLRGDPEKLIPRLKESLDKGFGAAKEAKTAWGVLLYGEKGAFSRFGAYVVHLSLLLFVAGGVVGTLFGYSGQIQLHEGETVDHAVSFNPPGQIHLPFALKLNRFTVEFYPDGMPSEYRSDVTVIENGQALYDKDILVNSPLRHRGITFYQSSYGPDASSPMTVRAKNVKEGTTKEIKLVRGRPQPLPGKGDQVTLMEYVENMMNAGPAVRLAVRPANGAAYSVWAYSKRPNSLPPAQGGYEFDLIGADIKYWTGLQVNRDPGTPLIWIGSGLMLAGFMVAFLLAHQKMYIGLVPKKGGAQIILAGSAHRNPGAFQIKFDRLAESLRRLSAGDAK